MKIICTMLTLATAFVMTVVAQPQRGERPERMLPAQAALDANSDGVISSAEMANASAALHKLDKNGDGKLTEDELRPNFERAPREGAASNGNEELVNNLMAFDENKDGKLSKQELPERLQGMFARADANQDGFLTREEIAKTAAAQPAPSANASGERGSGREEHDDHGARGEGRGGRGGARGMMRMMPMLVALDANSDGIITDDEINNAPAALKTLDKNGDGQLTEDELRPAFGTGSRGDRGGPGQQRPNGERPPSH